MSPFTFNLGDIVKDQITGFQGAIISRSDWYNGCVRYLVQPQELKDQRPVEPDWIDEPQLELLESTNKPEARRAGGPQKYEAKSPVG